MDAGQSAYNKLRNVKLCDVYLTADSVHRFKNQIKSSLYSLEYAEACNEWRGPSPRLSAWATQLRRNVAAVASRWRHCADLTGPGIEPQTSRTESVRLATELTAGLCTPFRRFKSFQCSLMSGTPSALKIGVNIFYLWCPTVY